MASQSAFLTMSRHIVECLRRPWMRLVGVHGWDGVGRQRVLRHAMDTLQQGARAAGGGGPNNDDNNNVPLFTWVVQLSEDKGTDSMTLQRRIHGVLRAVRDEQGQPYRLWPVDHRMLVVIHNLQHPINLRQASNGDYPKFYWPVQIVFSCDDSDLVNSMESSPSSQQQQQQGWGLDSSRHATSISQSFADLSNEEALNLLWHEAGAIADQLHHDQQQQQQQQQQHQGGRVQLSTTSRDAIMECFLYTALFPVRFHAPDYWLSEGLLEHWRSRGSPNLDDDYHVVGLLITHLMQRSMLTKPSSGSHSFRNVQMATPLVKKVRAIITSLDHLSSSSSSSGTRNRMKGRFLVKILEGLTEAPAAMQCLDQDDITRVSLADNNIQRLRLPPHHRSSSSSTTSGGDCSRDNNIFTALHVGPRPITCANHLSTLILAFNRQLQEIEDDFFKWTPNLRVLNLSSTALSMLPPSLTCLTNLRLLCLDDCKKLGSISPYIMERGFQSLEILLMLSCPLLSMTTASFRQVRNLRLLRLGESSFQNLEVLDLSGTKIEEFPDVSSMTNLTRLDLLNTRELSYVSWPSLERLPSTINWDQCGSGTSLPKSRGGPCISVKEADIFRRLSYDSQLWSQCFSNEFYISVSPCIEQQQEMTKPKYPRRKNSSFPYTHVISQFQQSHHHQQLPPSLPIDHMRKHLQICSGTSPLTMIMEGVLPHAQSLHLSDHETVKNLLVSYPMELEQCHVRKCPSIETIFHGKPAVSHASTLANLKYIHLFHLNRLETLYKGQFGPASLPCLRRVHIVSCPRIITVFSSPHIVLGQLEELVIKLCGNLRRVFGEGAMGNEVAPALNGLYLWDLQELRNICDGHLPSLQTLKLRGCAKLQALPLPPVDRRGNPFKLDIMAEHKWWENLNEANKKHINFTECLPGLQAGRKR